jgi:hypothetical protein
LGALHVSCRLLQLLCRLPSARGAAGGNSVVQLLQAMLLLLHQHTQLGNLGVGCKFGLLESIGALLLLQQLLGGC